MFGVEVLDAFGGSEEADKFEGLGLGFFEAIDRRDRRVARGQHWINHQHFSLMHIGRNFEVILYGDVGAGVAVETDVPHPRRGHQL